MNIVDLLNKFKDPILIESLSLGEKVSASLFVTLLGMTITFAALVVLWVLTASYSKMVQNAEAKEKSTGLVEVNKAPEPPALVLPTAQAQEDQDVLVAIITAAITAGMDTSMNQIHVKSIVRVPDYTPAWGQSGRKDQMTVRL